MTLKSTLKSAILSLTLIFIGSSKFQAKACHALAILNPQVQAVAGGVQVTATSDPATCGCAVYWLDIEVRCLNDPFNSGPFNPGFWGPLNSYPFFQSAQMNKPNCTAQDYPWTFIPYTGLCPGLTYKIRMRENHNGQAGPWCNQLTFTVPGSTAPLAVSLSSSGNNICAGACVTLTPNVTNGCNQVLSYLWSPGGATTSTLTVCPGSTTTYTCTVTEACSNFSASANMTINVTPAPVAGTATIAPATICSGQTVNLNLTGSAGGIQWQSAPNAGGPWTNIGGATNPAYTSPALTANTCFRAQVSGCGPAVFSNVVCVTVNPVPTLSVNSATVCAGNSATLTATPNPAGGTFSWSPGGQTTASITVSPASTTTYTCTYTVGGCTATASGTVTVNPAPTVNVNSTSICPGNSATLTATVNPTGGTYSWSPGGQTTQSITVSPASTTTYTVTYTLAGCTATASGTVTVGGTTTVNVNSTSICAGQNGTLTATPGTPGGTYSWAPGGQTTQSITVSPASTTTYTVTYNLGGCVGTGTGTVTVNPLPTVAVNSVTVCAGSPGTLTGNVNPAGGTFSWAPGGMTTASITQSPAATTTYTLTYTSPAGCVNTGTGTITVNPIPTVNVNSASICPGNNATLTATPNPTGGTYSWAPGGQTTQSITVSPAVNTTYTVTYTLNGCTATGSGTVTINSNPTIAVTSTSICAGQSGTITANPSSPGGTYSWSPGGQTTQSITVSPAATTTYTVTYNMGGCIGTGSGTVTVDPIPTVAVTSTAVCAGSSATLTSNVNPTGGMYSWSPTGQTGANLTDAPAATTTYTLTYTSPAGCVNTGTGTITINPIPTVTVNSPSICSGQSATLNATVNPTGGNFSWSPGGQTTGSITVSPAATTTYTVNYTSPAGCSNSGSGTVTLISAPTANFTPTSVCEGVSTQFTDLSTPGVNSWTYDFGDGSPVDNSQNPVHTYPTAGTFNATLTVDLNGCTGTATVPVTVNAMPQPSFTVTPACPTSNVTVNNTSTISSGSISNWNWSMPSASTTTSTLQTPSFSYPSGGSYNVTLVATSASGCTDSITQVVNIPYMPVPNFSFTTVCQGNPTAFTDLSTVTGGTITGWTWVWGDGQPVGTTQNPTHTYATAGTYTVTLVPTTNAGCTGPSVTYNVDVFTQPTAAFTVTDVCQNSPVVPNNTSVGPSTYSWDFGDGTPADPAQNPSHNYATAGNYTITLTVGSGSGCTATTTQTVNVFAMPAAAFTTASVCDGSPVVFTDQSTVAGGTITNWAWTFGDGNTSTTQSPSHTYANPGNYNVTLTVTSANGCTGTITQPVSVFAIPVVGFTPTDVCLGVATQFQNQSTISSGSITSYLWDFGNGNTSTQTNPTYTYPASGSYTVTLTATSGNGCTNTANITVTVHDIPSVSFSASATAACSPLCVNFTDNTTITGGSITNWSWNLGDGSVSTLQNPSHCYTNTTFNTQTFDITLTATSAFGCTGTQTLPAMITVYANPVAEFSFGPQPTTILDPVITFNNTTLGGSTYSWDFGDGSGTSTQVNPSYTYANEGSYIVTLATVSQHGCIDTVMHEVIIGPEFLIYVPNTFTPDGDGVNDIFIPYVSGLDPDNYEFMVFNRWGELIFQTDKVSKGWDGTHKDVKVKEDTYVWKIKLRDVVHGERKEYYGHVNVLIGR